MVNSTEKDKMGDEKFIDILEDRLNSTMKRFRSEVSNYKKSLDKSPVVAEGKKSENR